MTRLWFVILVALGFSAGSGMAQVAAADPAATAGFRSGGINAVITSTSVNARGLVIQFIIQNTRSEPIFITPITSGDISSAATSSGGNTYLVAGHGRGVSGMTACSPGGRTLNDNVTKCLKEAKVESMTPLDPGQTTVLAVSYDRRGREAESGDSVSFALKFLVRTASKAADGLGDGSQKAGPPAVVTISFPLIPLRAS